MKRWIARSACVASVMAVAACTTPAPPPPPPPPPVVTPAPAPMPRPYPPNSSAPNLVIPITDLSGRRLTPNVDLSPQQALWHLRIALNVAALNCRGAEGPTLIANYGRFLTNNRTAIAASERWVIADQGRKTGTNGVAARDTLSTRLYNYFAQPPVLQRFCPIAFNISGLAAVEPTATILPFSSQRLAEIDQPFVDFYAAYAQYQADFALWHAQNPAMSTVQPAVVAPSTVSTLPQPATQTVPQTTVQTPPGGSR